MILKVRSNLHPRSNLFTCDIILRDNARNGMDEYTWNSFTLSSRSYSHETRGKSIWTAMSRSMHHRLLDKCGIGWSGDTAIDRRYYFIWCTSSTTVQKYVIFVLCLRKLESEMFMIKVEKVFGCWTVVCISFGIPNVALERLIDLIFW